MISEEIKEKYFIEEVPQVTNDLTGWKVLGMTEKVAGVSFEIKTTLNGWMEEFRIKYTCIGGSYMKSGLILVNQDCPELYILYPDDIKELIDECISTINTSSIDDILNTANQNYKIYNPYTSTTWTVPEIISSWSQNICPDNSIITTTLMDHTALSSNGLYSNVTDLSSNSSGIC